MKDAHQIVFRLPLILLAKAGTISVFFRADDSPSKEIAAAGASTNLLSRVRSALYAAAASPQYQVKR